MSINHLSFPYKLQALTIPSPSPSAASFVGSWEIKSEHPSRGMKIIILMGASLSDSVRDVLQKSNKWSDLLDV